MRRHRTEEPLRLSAPLAWNEAPRLCYREATGDRPCRSYHQVWQYLRLLGFISSPRTNRRFFLEQVGRLASTAVAGRVLVTGTADYGLPALVAEACASRGEESTLMVVDRCATSLYLNGWYSGFCGVPFDLVQADVLHLPDIGSFDLICTHNFLSRFEGPDREGLVARWRALLEPGGHVVTTQRIRPPGAATRNRYTEAEARALSEAVAARARSSPAPLGVDPAALAEAVFDYAVRKGSFPIPSDGDVVQLFERHGFDVVLADHGDPGERSADRPSSPRAEGTHRLRIVARLRRPEAFGLPGPQG